MTMTKVLMKYMFRQQWREKWAECGGLDAYG